MRFSMALRIAALACQHHAHRAARARRRHRIDQHRPALFRGEAAHADQQGGLLGQLAQLQQPLAAARRGAPGASTPGSTPIGLVTTPPSPPAPSRSDRPWLALTIMSNCVSSLRKCRQ